MLEFLDLNYNIPEDEYKTLVAGLNARLAELQRAAKAAGLPILIVFEGWEGAGKGTVANKLLQPLDPRGITVYSIKEPTKDEKLHPFLWRFWMRLPAKGQIHMFDTSWYHDLLRWWAAGDMDLYERREMLDDITQFERQLTDRGMVVVKLWLHIDEKEQKKRLDAIGSDLDMAWRITKESKRQRKRYADYLNAVEEILAITDSPEVPWTLVEATHKRTVHVRVLSAVVQAIERALATRKTNDSNSVEALLEPLVPSAVLARIDLSRATPKDEYMQRLREAQARLRRLQYVIYSKRIPVVVAFEGWDAAGKGGAIKRLTQELDPRGYEVVSISAPTKEERAYPYWWRFWRCVPKDGHLAIFDRTWYGRVLVERIEGFCSREEWQRAYAEINEFESTLVHHGAVVVKFWLHIDADEQLRRFEARRNNPAKQWKITEEDWRNREKWLQYEAALEDMFRRTSTALVPWTIVEANDKCFARLKVIETVCKAIERRLEEV